MSQLMPNHQVAWHLKLFGRAACKPLAKDQRSTDYTTIIRNDVTCPRCAELVKQQWGELMARQPERTEEQVIQSPIYTRAVDKLAKSSVPLTGAGEVELVNHIGVRVPAARPKSATTIKSQMQETDPRIAAARKALNMQ